MDISTERRFNLRSPASVADHEFDHAVQRATNRGQFENDVQKGDREYDTKEERRVITGSEQKTARANGEIKEGEVTRTNHRGRQVITKGVTSNQIDTQKTQQYEEQKRKR